MESRTWSLRRTMSHAGRSGHPPRSSAAHQKRGTPRHSFHLCRRRAGFAQNCGGARRHGPLGIGVNFTGRIPDAQFADILSTADVCVNPDKPCEMNDISTMIRSWNTWLWKTTFSSIEGRAISAGDLPPCTPIPEPGTRFRQQDRLAA